MRNVAVVQQRLPSLRPEPIAFAHRGASANAPENTIAAFRLALEMGATGLESDVWATKDGHAVLDHDGTVRRLVRTLTFDKVDRDELPRHVPSFVELVETVGAAYDLSLDIKSRTAVACLAAAVRTVGFPVDRLWLCSPSLEVLEECGRAIEGANLVHSTRLDRIDGTLERHVAALAGAGIGTLNMHHTDWNGGRATLCHRFGIHAFGWDLQYEEPMRAAVRMGLDGVYSDRVDMMMSVVRAETGGAH